MNALPAAANVPEMSAAAIRRLLRDGDAVLWLGAGISLWEPTALPTGLALRDWFLDQVFGDVPELRTFRRAARSSRSRFRAAVGPISPEPVGSSLTHGIGLKFLDGWIEAFRDAEPNALHHAIAQNVRAARAPLHVVTTNFDLCLEKAGSGGRVVRAPSEIPRRMGGRLLVKVHGCASEPRSMYPFITRFNSFIPPVMRRLLERITDGKTILFAGYSASDFDLLPILQELRPRSVVFVIRSDADLDASLQQRLLIARHRGAKITGIDRLLAHLGTRASLVFGTTRVRDVAAAEDERVTAAAHLLRAVNFCDEDVALVERSRRRVDRMPRDLRTKVLDSLSFAYREINDFDRSEKVLIEMHAARLITRRELTATQLSIAILRHDFDAADRLIARLARGATAKETTALDVARARIHMHRVALGQEPLDARFIASTLRRQLRAAIREGDIDAILGARRFEARRLRLQLATARRPSRRQRDALARAREGLEEVLFWWRAVGRRQGTINTLRELAMLERTAGRPDVAYERFRQALDEQQVTGSSRYDRIKILWALRHLAQEMGDLAAARRHERALQRYLASQPPRMRRQWRNLLRDLDNSGGFVG